MARAAHVEKLAGSLDAPFRRVFKDVAEYILNNLRFGRADNKARAENMQIYFFHVTTPAVANTEFEIVHGLSTTPYLIISVLPLDVAGKKTARLETSKPADATRIYLKSPDTNAPIVVMVEG